MKAGAMRVRAKFKVQSVMHCEGGASTAVLEPVVGGSEENKAFWKWTPAGKIEIRTINTEAAAQFVPGAEMYVDFTPADAEG